jgi:hypothetical protein
MLCHIQHHYYEDEHPAYTFNTEEQIRKDEKFGKRCGIDIIATRVDPNNRKERRKFLRRERDGRIIDDVQQALTQSVFIKMLINPAQNTPETRKTWGMNLAKLFQYYSKQKYGDTGKNFEFFSDITPPEGPTGCLGDVIPIQEAMDVARMMFGGVTTEQILSDPGIMHGIFGDAQRIQEVHDVYHRRTIERMEEVDIMAAHDTAFTEALGLDPLGVDEPPEQPDEDLPPIPQCHPP